MFRILELIEAAAGFVARAFVMEKYKLVSGSEKITLDKKLQERKTEGMSIEGRAYNFILDLFKIPSGRIPNPSKKSIVDIFKIKAEQDNIVCGWGFTSTLNPTQDNCPDTVMIHGFSKSKYVKSSDAAKFGEEAQTGQAYQSHDGPFLAVRPAISLLNSPLVLQTLNTSASLITAKKCPSASPVGFVLNVPVWNLCRIGSSDLNFANDASRSSEPEDLARGPSPDQGGMGAFMELWTMSPDELIRRTDAVGGANRYNEVPIMGRSPYNTQIRVTGIYVKVKNVQNELMLVDDSQEKEFDMSFYGDGKLIPKIQECSRKHNLPIVPILDDHNDCIASDVSLVTLLGKPVPLKCRFDWSLLSWAKNVKV